MTEEKLQTKIKIPEIAPDELEETISKAASSDTLPSESEVTFEVEEPSDAMNVEWEIQDAPDAPEFYEEPAAQIQNQTRTSYEHTSQTGRTYTYSGHNTKEFNKHIYTWIFSFFLGVYGIDRFARGQIGMGILKLITGGGFGFWYLGDLLVAVYKSYGGEFRDLDNLVFDDDGRYIF